MQIRTVRYHYIAIRMAKAQRLTTPNTGKDVEHWNSHSLLVGKQNSIASLEDSLVISHKSQYTLNISILPLAIYSKELKFYFPPKPASRCL